MGFCIDKAIKAIIINQSDDGNHFKKNSLDVS